MERCAKIELLRSGKARAALCEELAQHLSQRLRGAADFHRAVKSLVSELRLLGHDLWSFDEDDDFEIWCPDYVNPTGPGIMVTFRPDSVAVAWREDASSKPV